MQHYVEVLWVWRYIINTLFIIICVIISVLAKHLGQDYYRMRKRKKIIKDARSKASTEKKEKRA